MNGIPRDLIERMAKVCGMLGSDQHGERSAAAFQATKILKGAGLTWRELIEAAGPRDSGGGDAIERYDWRDQLDACLAVRGRFTAWEHGFLDSLQAWADEPTEKQQRVLDKLYRRATGL